MESQVEVVQAAQDEQDRQLIESSVELRARLRTLIEESDIIRTESRRLCAISEAARTAPTGPQLSPQNAETS